MLRSIDNCPFLSLQQYCATCTKSTGGIILRWKSSWEAKASISMSLPKGFRQRDDKQGHNLSCVNLHQVTRNWVCNAGEGKPCSDDVILHHNFLI